jgi:hypothetical protein
MDKHTLRSPDWPTEFALGNASNLALYWNVILKGRLD